MEISEDFTQFYIAKRPSPRKSKTQRTLYIDNLATLKKTFYLSYYFCIPGPYVIDNDIVMRGYYTGIEVFYEFCLHVRVCCSLVQKNVRRMLHNRAVKRVMTFDEASKEVLPEVLLTVIRSYL